jgi:WD40 repeat protein/tRNA A-37 threonylcarbamoyl transferase component Bud32
MSYCLNPNCRTPQNLPHVRFCVYCGTKLLLGDRYRPLKVIGQGGFGRTFLAVDEAKPSKPSCVIKQFYPQSQGTNSIDKAAQLFEQEAIRLDQLGRHPQIPDLLAYLIQDNRQYLVQQFIDGENLGNILNQQGKFTLEQILDILHQLLPVLDFIHTNNIIHRDIKPENIIKTHDNHNLVLVDFGAAKIVTGTNLVGTGTIIGSAGFVSPEQAIGKATFASDIYSLGVTCIHLLTQMHPFDLIDSNQNQWVWKDFFNDPIDEYLASILDRMIADSLNERYQSATAIIDDLNRHQVKQKLSVNLGDNLAGNWSCVRTLTGHNDLFAGIRSMAFTPDSKNLASGSEDYTIKIWSLQTGKERRTLKNHSHFIRAVVFTSDGEILISASDDHTIKVWNWEIGEEICTLKVHGNNVTCLAISPDGKMLASGSDDKTIKLWNMQTKQEIFTFTGHTDYVQTLAFHPDGKILASGGCDYTIKFWNLSTKEEEFTLKEHTSYVKSICFSHDGKYLVSGSDDNTIKLWQWKIREIVYSNNAHSGWLYGTSGVDISADDQLIISGGNDQTLKIWQLETGELLSTIKDHKKAVNCVAFSPNGAMIATGSNDKTIKIYQRS